jgi:hypothetical protein
MLNANSPYIYDISLVQPNPNAIDMVLDVKTASELGLNTRQARRIRAPCSTFSAEDDDIGSAVTAIPGADAFQRGWADLLPGSDAAVMKVLASNATAAFGATAHRLDLVSNKPDAPGGAWVEEFGVFHSNRTRAARSDRRRRRRLRRGGGYRRAVDRHGAVRRLWFA